MSRRTFVVDGITFRGITDSPSPEQYEKITLTEITWDDPSTLYVHVSAVPKDIEPDNPLSHVSAARGTNAITASASTLSARTAGTTQLPSRPSG